MFNIDLRIVKLAEIYKLTFANGKIYIGATRKTAKHRFYMHRGSFRQNCKSHLPLYKAWAKYGEPKLEILEKIDLDKMWEREIFLIAQHKSQIRSIGYNVDPGGPKEITYVKYGPRKPMGIEQRFKISIANKGRSKNLSPEGRAKLSEIGKLAGLRRKGVIAGPRSSEAKERMRQAQLRRWANTPRKAKPEKSLTKSNIVDTMLIHTYGADPMQTELKTESFRLPLSIRTHLQHAKNNSPFDKTELVKMALTEFLNKHYPMDKGQQLPLELEPTPVIEG